MLKTQTNSSFKDKIVKTIIFTNNFNISIYFLNSRNFGKMVLYIKTEAVVVFLDPYFD